MGQPLPPRNNPLGLRLHAYARIEDWAHAVPSAVSILPLAKPIAFIEVVLAGLSTTTPHSNTSTYILHKVQRSNGLRRGTTHEGKSGDTMILVFGPMAPSPPLHSTSPKRKRG